MRTIQFSRIFSKISKNGMTCKNSRFLFMCKYLHAFRTKTFQKLFKFNSTYWLFVCVVENKDRVCLASEGLILVNKAQYYKQTRTRGDGDSNRVIYSETRKRTLCFPNNVFLCPNLRLQKTSLNTERDLELGSNGKTEAIAKQTRNHVFLKTLEVGVKRYLGTRAIRTLINHK